MEATIFHSSLLMSFFSFFLVTFTSLRTLFNSMSCLSSASFVMTSIEWAALLGADNAGAHEFVSSSSMDCKLLSNLWNSLGSPVVDKASLSKPDSLGSDDTVLERLLTQYGELVVQGFDWKSPGELKHLWRVMGGEILSFVSRTQFPLVLLLVLERVFPWRLWVLLELWREQFLQANLRR